MGYPMLQVKEMKITDGKARLSLEQSWFLTSGEPPKKKCKWCIPVFVCTAQTTQPMVTMTEESMNLEIPIGSDSDFILLNQGVHWETVGQQRKGERHGGCSSTHCLP